MKLNQNILNAINEGIRKSLISFDDVQFEQSTDANQKVSKTIKDWQWIQDNFVDLGLPSGTLWCKQNIGATCGDTVESWYGGCYAWGETKTKYKYTSKNYTYKKEKPEVLPDEKDIAYLTNNLMHMPTEEQIQELKTLPSKWVTDYNEISGLNGRIFTGTNGNELFIPAAGNCDSSSCRGFVGSSCYLWSKSLNTEYPNYAQYLDFDSSYVGVCNCLCCCGLSVRGVVDKL